MEYLFDVLFVFVAPAVLGLIHAHMRWVLMCSAAAGGKVFWRAYVGELSPDRDRVRAIVLAPLSFLVGSLPFVVVTTLVFWVAVWASHGRFSF